MQVPGLSKDTGDIRPRRHKLLQEKILRGCRISTVRRTKRYNFEMIEFQRSHLLEIFVIFRIGARPAALNKINAYRIQLQDADADVLIPQGAGATVAVYTQRGKPVHIITKVVMRMQAWLAYLTSPTG